MTRSQRPSSDAEKRGRVRSAATNPAHRAFARAGAGLADRRGQLARARRQKSFSAQRMQALEEEAPPRPLHVRTGDHQPLVIEALYSHRHADAWPQRQRRPPHTSARTDRDPVLACRRSATERTPPA